MYNTSAKRQLENTKFGILITSEKEGCGTEKEATVIGNDLVLKLKGSRAQNNDDKRS